MQNLFNDIRNKLPKLRKVETRVQTAGGELFVERRDEEGGFSGLSNPTPRGPQRCAGFVYDFKPDLQMALVAPGLYVGSQDVAAEKEILKSKNVLHIVNAASGIGNHFPEDFRYMKLNILDLPEQDIKSVFESCFAFIDEALAAGGSTFVHCNAGVSRSSTICIAYLISRQRMRLNRALNKVRSERPIVRPNDGFMRQLREFEAETLGIA
ncbi:dual specificity protein phosphatase 19-like [Tropilaelaps mercedesae]|uniref:Dual specificity protein phosphatase 19-like n=1 Tax=Tropilaelaps mercedesae TaxID=418985 RepID=A0A1V9XKK9_9ACAR|nr:dual specificity protein phosphatase 19-like [Tropilaelaps mercedesae]